MIPDFSTHTLVVIHERAEVVKCDGTAPRCHNGPCAGNCNGRCTHRVGFVPTLIVDDLCRRIAGVKTELKAIKSDRREIVSHGGIRDIAKLCSDCNLCKVCAGDHRRYSRDFGKCWPPGQEKCFAFLSKGGAPLRPAPCKLCDAHDALLRESDHRTAKANSAASKAKTKLRALYAERRALVEQHPIDTRMFEA